MKMDLGDQYVTYLWRSAYLIIIPLERVGHKDMLMLNRKQVVRKQVCV